MQLDWLSCRRRLLKRCTSSSSRTPPPWQATNRRPSLTCTTCSSADALGVKSLQHLVRRICMGCCTTSLPACCSAKTWCEPGQPAKARTCTDPASYEQVQQGPSSADSCAGWIPGTQAAATDSKLGSRLLPLQDARHLVVGGARVQGEVQPALPLAQLERLRGLACILQRSIWLVSGPSCSLIDCSTARCR